MARSYGAVPAADLVVEADVIEQARHVEILVCPAHGGLAGFASIARLYPVAGLVPFLYVQQLYVAEAARRTGVARSLMAAIAGLALRRGFGRVEWSTGRDNQVARALYEALGAAGSDKVHYGLAGAELAALAAPPSR